DAIASASADAPPPLAAPDNLAYVIYTSGSTGKPKGVLIEHRTASAVLHWLRGAVTDEERACALGATSVCFDVSVAEIFGTLCWGGTLVLVDDALALAHVREPIRLASMVPTAAAELLRQGAIPPTIRTLALGGEPVTRALADALYAGTGVERILNLYGPTEDTTYSTCVVVPRDPHHPVTVGRPVTGSAVRVLDGGFRPVEAGGEGELFMAGAGVTRGYLRRPGLTAERYLPDPLSPLPGARMYRTGDLGRARPDGEYDCLGRRDRQVKIRGFRVEPEEVEAALAAHPALAEAAVAAQVDAAGETRLVAWTAAAAGTGAPSGAELRAFLKARLPDWMIPGAFVPLPALPRTPNGKVDRLALVAPEAFAREDAAYVAPRTPVEEILCTVWARVMGEPRIGVRDDFFALGGHSLRAVQIVARLRETLGVELPLPAVFQAPTVEALATEVERAMGSSPSTEAIESVDRSGPLPLSPAQEAVWFFERLSPGMRSYQFQAALRMRGDLDAPALERALTEVVRRHEIFRTVFREVDGHPAQLVQPPWAVALPVVDATALPDDEVDARYAEAFARPFDAGALPLVRWTLFRTGAREHVLLIVEHHLVHDGWSFGVFLRELTSLYAALVHGDAPPPEPRLQFGDFAVWQRAWTRSAEARRGLEFWKQKLAGAPPALDLPTDFPRPPRISFRGESVHVHLPTELAHAADEFSRRHGVTLYMTLTAAFQALVRRYTGQEDFCLGGGSAGRRLRESEDLIGMIVNVIPLRADLRGDPDFHTLVQRVRRTALEAYPHQDVPFADIVDAVQPERSLDRLPIFQAAFNMHHAPYPDLRVAGLELDVTEALGNATAKFDLQVIVIPRAQQNAAARKEVALIWEYATELFRRETVERMWGHYQRLLASLLADPVRPVSAAPLLDDAERAQVVDAWSRAEGAYPRDATLHALFREQAARAPYAPAIDWGTRTMTYEELEAASERVARRLRALRLGAEARIGVAMERGPELIAAVLGVLKAGGAHVPLDADFPAARLAFMQADAGVAALVVADTVPAALADFAGPVLRMDALDDGSAAVIPADAIPADVIPADVIPADADGADANDAADSFAAADSLASVFYTSGSTGTPKGIGITHRGVVRLVRGTNWADLEGGARVSQTASAAFDAFSMEVWGALLNGGCIVGIDRDTLLSPAGLRTRVREGRITTLFLTPAVFNEVAREAPDTFAGIEIVTGGEAAEPESFRRALRAGARRVANVYGPTENSSLSTVCMVDALPEDAASVPIGRPIVNSTVYVLDERMEPCPAGVPGELYVGGAGVARGYVGRPGLTADRFVPDPFGPAGARLYRTGDRGRWLPEGEIEFLGRVDAQVKIRGFRIEPGEVEAALRALPEVADAAVAARADGDGALALAAYVVPAPGGETDAAGVRARLAERLPHYMMPATITLLDALPLTATGKVDRRALPDPAPPPAVEAGFEPPATDDERAIAAAWAEALGVERIGATDGFFALG
ncbi:MAG TPA: amino acid adenylation domain-containing protein, partial [Longimicrobium sp.]|nr:amino acid adenylation domain-containing protein [Longimicrobium sp.]